MGAGFTAAEIIGANQTAQGPAGLRHQAHVAFKTAYDLLEQAAKITNRRKAFLYLSSGYDFNPYTDDRFNAATDAYASGAGTYRNPFDSPGQQFSEAELTAELVELTQAARRANVTFYPIDPRGLVAGPSIGSNVSMQNFQNQVQTSTSSLKVLADQTGGLCICQTNDFAAGLRKVDEAMSDYYLIGYVSTNTNALQIRRRIEVRVNRADVTVSGYKREYMIKR